MATSEQPQDPKDPNKRPPISPATRKRLQAQFEAGSKAAANGGFEYATDMLMACLKADPGNQIYAQNFLANLYKFYNNNKTGAKMSSIRGASARGTLKKAEMQKEWNTVLEQGLELIKLNPWDTSALVAMAAACEQQELDESQLIWLRAAVEADMKEPETNRALGRALARQGQFDQAINTWQRVLQAKPQDVEARRALSNLSVEKTIHKGGYEDAEGTRDLRADKGGASDGPQLTPEQQWLKAIAKDPSNADNYMELVNLYTREENFAKAEEMLEKAMQLSGGDVTMREKLEDVQIRRARQQVSIAEKRAQTEKTPEAEQLFAAMKADLNSKEVQIYRSRAERYPTHLGFKYELAVRLQRSGEFNEAIKLFQEARADTKRKGAVLLALGECFFGIKQYKLALSNFEAAVAEIPEREPDQKKHALWLTGRLALAMKDADKADKYLNELAGIDFGYKDVSKLLDKLNELRDSA